MVLHQGVAFCYKKFYGAQVRKENTSFIQSTAFSNTMRVSATIRKSSGLYYKRVTIVIDAPSVVKVTLQIVASLTIVTRL